MLKALTLLIAASLSAVFASAQTAHFTPERVAQIEAYIEARMADTKLPGAALVLVENGETVYVRGFGVTGHDDAAVTPDTIFAIGSISKSFLANAVIQDVEAGLIDLDAPIATYIPWFETRTRNSGDKITVRHLLNHTSGLSTHDGNIGQDATNRAPAALERSVRGIASLRLHSKPGTRFEYSNANYKILGHMLERLHNKTYAQIIREAVFDRAGMTRSTILRADADDQASPHRYRFTSPHQTGFHAGAESAPQGGVYTSASDMGRYLGAMLRGLDAPDGLWRPTLIEPRVEAFPEAAYGLGWMVEGPEGDPFVYHSGMNPGFSAHAGFAPQRGLGYAILTNASQGQLGGDVSGLLRGVHSLVLARDPPAAKTFKTMRTIFAALVGLGLALLIWIAIFAARLLKGKITPKPRKGWGRLGPALLSLGLAVLAFATLSAIPRSSGAPLDVIRLFNPDIGWALTLVGGLAALWLITRQFVFIALRWIKFS